MSPIFKCLICRKDIERSTKTFWTKKGHLLCSTCLDNIDKKQMPHQLPFHLLLEKKDPYNLANSICLNEAYPLQILAQKIVVLSHSHHL